MKKRKARRLRLVRADDWDFPPWTPPENGLSWIGDGLRTKLRKLSDDFEHYSQKPNADGIIAPVAAMLRALSTAMDQSDPAILTRKPSTKQSPHAWAKMMLRSAGVDPPVLPRHEAVEGLLRAIEQVANREAPRSVDVSRKRCILFLRATEHFLPQLIQWEDDFPPDLLRFERAKDLEREIELRGFWRDYEGIMRACLRICGAPKDKVRSLTNFMNRKPKPKLRR